MIAALRAETERTEFLSRFFGLKEPKKPTCDARFKWEIWFLKSDPGPNWNPSTRFAATISGIMEVAIGRINQSRVKYHSIHIWIRNKIMYSNSNSYSIPMLKWNSYSIRLVFMILKNYLRIYSFIIDRIWITIFVYLFDNYFNIYIHLLFVYYSYWTYFEQKLK